jgi:hypothetical protein
MTFTYYDRIKNCNCKEGDNKTYCKLKKAVCTMEEDIDAIRTLEKTKFFNVPYEVENTSEKNFIRLKAMIMLSILAAEGTKINKNLVPEYNEESFRSSGDDKEVRYDGVSSTLEEHFGLKKGTLGQLDFNHFIKQIKTRYKNHEEFVFNQLFKSATSTVPRDGVSVDKNKLIMEHYVRESEFGDSVYPSESSLQTLDSLPKMINILIDGKKASEAKTNFEVKSYYNKGYEFFDIHEVDDHTLKKIQFFKNSKMTLTLDSHESAKKLWRIFNFQKPGEKINKFEKGDFMCENTLINGGCFIKDSFFGAADHADYSQSTGKIYYGNMNTGKQSTSLLGTEPERYPTQDGVEISGSDYSVRVKAIHESEESTVRLTRDENDREKIVVEFKKPFLKR